MIFFTRNNFSWGLLVGSLTSTAGAKLFFFFFFFLLVDLPTTNVAGMNTYILYVRTYLTKAAEQHRLSVCPRTPNSSYGTFPSFLPCRRSLNACLDLIMRDLLLLLLFASLSLSPLPPIVTSVQQGFAENHVCCNQRTKSSSSFYSLHLSLFCCTLFTHARSTI